MPYPSPARCAPSRSTRELTLAEIFDPATFTRSRRRFKAIRDCAVYSLHAGGGRGVLVALDRSYRPLGVRVAASVRLDYSLFPQHRFASADLHLDGPWLSSPPSAEGRSFWAWSGSTAPYASAANLARYRFVLLDVFGREGLARLAPLAGRELGEYPDRATCEAAFRHYAAGEACFTAEACPSVSMAEGRDATREQPVDLDLDSAGRLSRRSAVDRLEDAPLTPAEWNQLRAISRRTGVPVTEFIVAALRMAIGRPALVLPPEAIGLRRVPRSPQAAAPAPLPGEDEDDAS